MGYLVYCAVVVLALVSSGWCKEKPVERAGSKFSGRAYSSVITVLNGGQFGKWTWAEMCPDTFYAVGFSIRVESKQYSLDDTALNGVRLVCARDEDRSFLYSIESHTGYYGEWSQAQYCPRGVLTSFQLRVEPYQGTCCDDTSANNIRFRCSSHPVLEWPGMDWGEYGLWSPECPQGGGICGIESKMEENQRDLDDTTLNDVRFFCCDRPQQVEQAPLCVTVAVVLVVVMMAGS